MIGGATLGGEGGIDIGMGNVLVAGSVKVQGLGLAARIADDGGASLFINRSYLAPRAVDPACIPVVAGEPDVVAGLEFERLR